MNVTVLMRSCHRSHFIHSTTQFFLKELKLQRYKPELIIVPDRENIRDSLHRGWTARHGDLIFLSVQHRLTPRSLMLTLAHEMVHVKQMVTGQLSIKDSNEGTIQIWNGVEMPGLPYEEQPWEIEAYTKQGPLVTRLIEVCNI